METQEYIVKAKSIVAERYNKSWEQIKDDYDTGCGVSKLMSEECMMDLVIEECLALVIEKKQLIKLAKSIDSADPTGHEVVIKDL